MDKKKEMNQRFEQLQEEMNRRFDEQHRDYLDLKHRIIKLASVGWVELRYTHRYYIFLLMKKRHSLFRECRLWPIKNKVDSA